MAKAVKCPKCKSLDISPVATDKKPSLAKGLIGGAVFGIVGATAGLMNGTKEVTFRCNECGRIFSAKIK